MKPATTIITAAIVAIVAAYGTVKLTGQGMSAANHKESAYDRVVRTKTLRCGWINAAPYFTKDLKTGQFSGIYYDMTETMGQLLGLKIDWAYETSFGNAGEDLKAGRFDVACINVWPKAERAFIAEFTHPANYVGLGVYVAANDSRFDGHAELLNDPQFKIATMDGEMSDIIQKSDFPQAQTVSHTMNSDLSQLMLDVTTRKADAAIVEKAIAAEFVRMNPGKIKDVTFAQPIRSFANGWLVAKGEFQLLSTLNIAIDEMNTRGLTTKIMYKYQQSPDSFYPVAAPYQVNN